MCQWELEAKCLSCLGAAGHQESSGAALVALRHLERKTQKCYHDESYSLRKGNSALRIQT